MDISASQCSNGCESGWTRYLDQSSLSETQFHVDGGMEDYYRGKGAKMEKEEDLSLVSDASSGPSHYLEDDEECIHDNGCNSYSSSASERARKNKRKIKANEHGRHDRLHSNLDDTASSPALSFSKVDSTLYGNEDSTENLLKFSQGLSATHFEVKPTAQKHFTFLKSFAKKPASEDPAPVGNEIRVL